MRATMTDVQKAIEQLGGPADDNDDGARSFSFASTKGGDTETDDTDFDPSDVDKVPNENWHKSARRKLAAKARRAVENAKQLEALMDGASGSARRTVAPPIEVEISDESDAEDGGDHTRTNYFRRTHPGILEEEENEGSASPVIAAEAQQDSTHVEVPARDESDLPTATAEVQSFQVPLQPISGSTVVDRTSQPEPQRGAEILVQSASVSYPTPVSLAPDPESAMESRKHLYSPPNGLPTGASTRQVAPLDLNKDTPNGISEKLVSEPQSQTSPMAHVDEFKKIATSEWTVEQVVQWLKSKGFDQGICDKFIGMLHFPILACSCYLILCRARNYRRCTART